MQLQPCKTWALTPGAPSRLWDPPWPATRTGSRAVDAARRWARSGGNRSVLRRWRKQSRAARTTVQISPDSIQLRGINLKTNPTTVVRVDLPQLRKSLRALETLSVEAVLDGEIVALNGDGSHPQRSMQDNRAGALLLYKRCPA